MSLIKGQIVCTACGKPLPVGTDGKRQVSRLQGMYYCKDFSCMEVVEENQIERHQDNWGHWYIGFQMKDLEPPLKFMIAKSGIGLGWYVCLKQEGDDLFLHTNGYAYGFAGKQCGYFPTLEAAKSALKKFEHGDHTVAKEKAAKVIPLEIEIEKSINFAGEKMIKVVRLSGLTKEQLPVEYVTGVRGGEETNLAAVWITERASTVPTFLEARTGLHILLMEGSSYDTQSFHDRVTYIKRAGHNLAEINAELRMWKGREVIKI